MNTRYAGQSFSSRNDGRASDPATFTIGIRIPKYIRRKSACCSRVKCCLRRTESWRRRRPSIAAEQLAIVNSNEDKKSRMI